ncbi:MAG: ABC transporter permease [Lentisphaeria bacterium]|nr:ABC transporter permease [Lentisphaeria bacterium]
MPDYILVNIAYAFVLILGVIGVVFVYNHSFWGPRLRNSFRKPFQIIALLCAVFYLTIAFLDAFSWKSQAVNSSLHASQPRSMFDRGFEWIVGEPEWEYKEDTYSAPLAEIELFDQSVAVKHTHLLGTTKTGQDTLYMVLKGCRPAITIGILPLLFSVPVALLFGILAGFYGGLFDEFVVYICTTLASIPGLLLLIALITALGQGFIQVAIGLGVASFIGLCRLSRAETFKLREMEYIQAAVCLGVPKYKILLRHIVPNLMHIIIITSILSFTALVLSESVLSYLGIGLAGSWGAMIDNARTEIAQDPVIWWNIIFASVALFVLVLSVNIVGDTLRDALDPKSE